MPFTFNGSTSESSRTWDWRVWLPIESTHCLTGSREIWSDFLKRRMKINLSITDGAKYWGLFKSFEAIRILSMLYMFSKSKTLGKYYNYYIFRRINGTLKDIIRLYNVSLFPLREKD